MVTDLELSFPTIINKLNLKQVQCCYLTIHVHGNTVASYMYVYMYTTGLTLFLKEARRHGNEKLFQDFPELHPDCSHLLAVLQCRDETDNVMGLMRGKLTLCFYSDFLGGSTCMSGALSFSSLHHNCLVQGLLIGQRLVEAHSKQLHFLLLLEEQYSPE